MRRAARTDNNQTDIIKLLRQVPGISVAPNHHDLLVGFRGKTYWFEIKNPNAISKKTNTVLQKRKQESQIKLEKKWTGHYKVVTRFEEIMKEIK